MTTAVASMLLLSLPAGVAHSAPRSEAAPTRAVATVASDWLDLEYQLTYEICLQACSMQPVTDGTADAQLFNPPDLDPTAFAMRAKGYGARAVMLPARKSDGFRIWNSRSSSHGVADTGWRGGNGDVVAEFAQACAKAGLAFGVSLALDDWAYGGNAEQYEAALVEQVGEILDSAGDVREFRLDCGPLMSRWPNPFDLDRVVETIRMRDSDAAIIGPTGPDGRVRYWSRGRFAPEIAIPAACDAGRSIADLPWVLDVPLRPSRHFVKQELSALLTVDQLMDAWFASVGRGANLNVVVPVMGRGRVYADDATRLGEFGEELSSTFATNLARAAIVAADAASLVDADRATVWSPAEGARTATVEFNWAQPVAMDIVRLDRVPDPDASPVSFVIEVPDAADADGWSEVARGTLSGQRAVERFPCVRTPSMRLTFGGERIAIGSVGFFARAPLVLASVPAGNVPAGTELTLSTDWPDAVVRFTTDGSEPNERSPAVTGPITIDRTVTLKARAFAPDRRSVRSITLRYSCPEGAAPARKGAAVEGR